MAFVLCITCMMPAHVYPFVPILQELQARGHKVRFAIVPDVRASGDIGGVPILQLDVGTRDPNPTPSAPGYPLDSFARYGEPIALCVEDVLVREHPDVVVIDPMLWGGMAAAEAYGRPWVSVSHNPKTIRALGLDVRGPGLPPPRTALGRLGHRIVGAAIELAGYEKLKMMNEVRNRRRLEALRSTSDLFCRPTITIATTAPPFEYPRDDWHHSVKFVGPIIWEPPAGSGPDAGVEAPFVLVSGSSVPETGPAGRWNEKVLQALSTIGHNIVATFPAGPLPEISAPNVYICSFASHRGLLAEAICVVCHGGSGVTHKALAAGVPVVAIPNGHDRYEVARRVDVARAGVMLKFGDVSPARLRVAVSQALDRKDGAGAIAEAFRNAGGVAAASNAIEELTLSSCQQR